MIYFVERIWEPAPYVIASVLTCGLYAARRAMRACLQTKSEVKQKNTYYICMCHKKSLIANVIVWRLRNTNVIFT